MAQFFISFSGRSERPKSVECGNVEEARNEAIRLLGAYLAEHPGYADIGHWRVKVDDEAGKELLHVIVATVNVKGSVRDRREERDSH